MKKISANELKKLYFNYFKSRGHNLIPNSSLIPENDPTVLFTTAGMHPLVPFLLGETHPAGKRLVNVQRCIRTGDIDEVGDNSHLTMFEMLGNWSLGDYFKKEAIAMSFEFLTSDTYLNIPKDKLYVSVFAGDEEIPKDEESYNAWVEVGMEKDHIFFLPREKNFWILGSGVGPCGPDTEMFYDTGKESCCDACSPACDCGKYLEIWNNVFMQYKRDESGKIELLSNPNVDTGMGLERVLVVSNGLNSVYDSELFYNLKLKLEELSEKKYEDYVYNFRVVLDHLRAATFILGDNNAIAPSNTGQGYVLRRLIRRVIRHLKKLEIKEGNLCLLAEVIINDYKNNYPELEKNRLFINDELKKEEDKFNTTLNAGERLFNKVIAKAEDKLISGSDAFKLFDTFGFPLEMTIELASERDYKVDVEGFHEKFREHQEKSKTIDAGSFKGGLADDGIETVKYHTLAHIMLAVLQNMYGKDITQRGCNITSDRIRFDFNLDHKMTDEEKENLTSIVNAIIKENIPVTYQEMSLEEAKSMGAHGTFADKYGDIVKVYTIKDTSVEICGGPHVKTTGELGNFKIVKEESSSAGVRRIKAILE